MGKEEYLKTLTKGQIVAVRLENDVVKSAAVVEVKGEVVEVETVYHKKYTVSLNNILWVKTSVRWPKGVYKLLKGSAKDE